MQVAKNCTYTGLTIWAYFSHTVRNLKVGRAGLGWCRYLRMSFKEAGSVFYLASDFSLQSHKMVVAPSSRKETERLKILFLVRVLSLCLRKLLSRYLILAQAVSHGYSWLQREAGNVECFAVKFL